MNTIGQPVSRVDAADKITGQARYARDLAIPGMLYMKLVFAGRPHARILSVDTSEAEKMPGVVAILTAKDVPNNIYGLMVVDTPVFCDERVRYGGDRIAAVVAETQDQAAEAAKLVKVSYEDLPLLSDPVEAMKQGAPLIHDNRPGNVAHSVRVRRGDVAAGFLEADVIVEREYFTPAQEHAFLEPEAGLAYIDDEGHVTVRCAGQSAHDDRRQIAGVLGIPEGDVRVIYHLTGGAFGGREDISVQIVLALAAWKLRRPVKISWSRTESILGHGKRHPTTMRYRWGARRDGKIVAAEISVVTDAGAYTYTSGAVLDLFYFAAVGPYDIPNVSVDGQAIFTNNNPSCGFRGFGIPQAAFAAELQVEQLAEELGIDPITLRLRNCLKDDSLLPTQSKVVGGASLTELIETCARAAGASESENGWKLPTLDSPNPNKRRGIGLATGFKSSGLNFGFPETSEARVVLHGRAEIERAEVHTACAEVGQGSYTALAQIAAEELGLDMGKIEMITGDTSDVGDAGMTSASRLTLMAGNAVREAARLAMEAWKDEDRPAVGEGRWDAPKTTAPDSETGACFPFFSLSYGAQAVEVEVDIETGETELLRVVAVHDPGRMINPQLVMGQIYGGIIQAQGWAMIEDFITEQGKVLTDSLSTYLIPTALDVPPNIDVILIEKPDPVSSLGVRGMGEIPFVPLAPAIASAVRDATGVWFDSLPLKPERVLAGLQGQRLRKG
jgi:CO/xanthine dehydrogenase Mo-binding subunit